jgi:hypothetical protein
MCPYKIADGTTAKAAHLSWSKNLLFERRGDHNVFEENLSACHVVVRIGIKVTLHRTRTTNGRPYRQDKDFLLVSHTEVHFVIEMTSGGARLSSIDIDGYLCFVNRLNKDFYVTLHNKKKHAVACCPRVSTSHFNKNTVVMSLWFTIAQTIVGTIGASQECTL